MASAGAEQLQGDRALADDSTAETQASDTAQREKLLNKFYDSTNLLEILKIFESLCSVIGVDSTCYEGFYSSIKERLTSWKAGALWQLLDARAALPEYDGQRACAGKKVLVIGAGPVGLRAAIEAALLGASVDLVEKRDGFTRNNSLHLWPFLITDLRNLGAKKFYGKFAAGSIDHICIRILQTVLLKVCLLLAVKVYPGVTFTGLVEPKNANSGWSVTTSPASCPVSSPSRNYDIIIAADGKQNSLPGFRTKEFRAKLALAITVNFVNHNTKQESSVPEISGVAYVYRQDFFNSMAKELGIALENIVYYKDETHYFVMTAKKPSLLSRGVLKKDENDPKRLLAPGNIDRKALEHYAIEATTYATDGALGSVEFEKNHRGENDVALFDFTSLFASENAARIIERKGKRILLCVAGDSLLEPFWPTGSGCARGFLGALDAAWMMKRFASGIDPISLLEEREAILYLLPQTTPERLQKNLAGYTIDPKTRYTNLSELVPPGDVTHLYDTDDLNVINALKDRAQSTSTRRSKKETKSTAVPTQEEAKPKRSRSIEGLASHSQSLEERAAGAAKPVAMPTTHSSSSSASDRQSSEQAAQKARHFWQKNPTAPSAASASSAVAPPSGSNSKGSKSGEEGKKKDAKKKDAKKKESEIAASSSKPPLPTSAKEKKKVGTSSSTASSVPQSQPSASQQQSSKVQDRKSNVLSAAKSVKASPPASPELSKKKKRSLFGGGKARARSESPERTPKSSKRTSSKDSLVGHGGHPLQTATSVKSLDRESASVSESGGTNILDIIKRYDQRDELAKSQSKPGQAASSSSSAQQQPQEKKSTKGQKAADSAKKEGAGKGKGQKEKASKEDKKKEGKEGSSSKGWLSFLKRGGKAHEDETTTTKHQKKKAKKDKEKEKESSSKAAAEREPEHHHQLTIKGRIERLKESGVYTDGAEGTDASVVLVAVTKLTEEEEEKEEVEEVVERSDSLSPSQDETEMSPGTCSAERVEREERNTPSEEEEPADGGGEGESGEVPEAVDRVKRLQSIFQSVPERSPVLGRSLSTSASGGAKRSKEIDLSDLLMKESKSEEGSSHPLWLARIIQSLNKSLERLRKENDVMVAKTAMVILNTIISNVQSHPEDDVYRRVRVSSERFITRVWQYSNARQFLARAGWVEIDDFIVLPIGSKVDMPKRILDKHLDIVNQMLWSMQLEIPDSPGVLKRHPPNPTRERSLTAVKRSSYASQLVEESLERVEQDERAMAAARSKRIGSESSMTASISAAGPQGVDNKMGSSEESGRAESVSEDYLDSAVVPESRTEEVQTMRAAYAARSIWMQREVKKEETLRERNYRLILETELYDLPPPPAADRLQSDSDLRSRSPEDQPISFTTAGDVVSQRDSKMAMGMVETLAAVPEEDAENSSGMENEGMGMEPGVEDKLRKLTLNKSSSSLSQQSGVNQATEQQLGSVQEEVLTKKLTTEHAVNGSVQVDQNEEPLGEKTGSSAAPSISLPSTPQKDEKAGVTTPSISLPSTPQKDDSTTDSQTAPAAPTCMLSNSTTASPPNKKLHVDSSGSGGDQLRQLLLNTSQAAAVSSNIGGGEGGVGRSGSPSCLIAGALSNGDVAREEEGRSPSPPEEPKMSTADAQHPSESAIKSGRLEYERLAIQAAAETRQKWKETEASLTTNSKEERSYL